MRTNLLAFLCLALLWPGRDAWAAPNEVRLSVKDGALRALLFKPDGQGPFPAIIAIHGCGGLSESAASIRATYTAWADFLMKAGYAVLFPDSYGSRDLGPQCAVRERRIRASRERVADIAAARRWLIEQSWVKRDRISLLGWSNGSNSLLWAVRPALAARDGGPDFWAAVAFYPDCGRNSRLSWSARVPTLVLIGAEDDWSSARECQQMVEGAKGRSALARIVVYPGAYQGFDSDNLPFQERTGVATSRDGSGRVHVGANPAAREDARRRVVDWLGQ